MVVRKMCQGDIQHLPPALHVCVCANANVCSLEGGCSDRNSIMVDCWLVPWLIYVDFVVELLVAV